MTDYLLSLQRLDEAYRRQRGLPGIRRFEDLSAEARELDEARKHLMDADLAEHIWRYGEKHEQYC